MPGDDEEDKSFEQEEAKPDTNAPDTAATEDVSTIEDANLNDVSKESNEVVVAEPVEAEAEAQSTVEPDLADDDSTPIQIVTDEIAATENGTRENNKPIVSADPIPQSLSRRKFRITGLHYPGDDVTMPEIVECMLAAQSFHLWFEREPNKYQNRKKGGLSLSFDDEASARQAYSKIKGLVSSGAKWKINAHKSFDDSPAPQQETKVIKIPQEEDPECFQKLFVDQLLPSTDQDLIYAIFGKENLKNVDVRLDHQKSDGSKCAILTFHDRECTEQAKQEYDEFTVDDGDVSRPMRILLYVDYLSNLENERVRKQRASTGAFSGRTPTERVGKNVEAERRSTNERKGKAGNLWSAQIAENRGESVVTVTGKDYANVEAEQFQRAKSHERKLRTKAPLTGTEAPRVVHSVHTTGGAVESSLADAPPSPPPVEHTTDQEHQTHPCRPPSRAEGELSAVELAGLIEAAMERGRINWAELNTLEDLWNLVHHASKDAGWQPEMSLKEGMAVVLDRAYGTASADWQHDHLDALIKLWKKEVETDSRSNIRKQLQLSESQTAPATDPDDGPAATNAPVAVYTPPPSDKPEKRRWNKATKKALMHMMGVGALLADVKKDAEEEERQKATNVKGKKKEDKEKRKRKHSASESGEASTTTEDEGEDEGETSNWEEGTASSSDYRHTKPKEKHGGKQLPRKHQQRKKQPFGDARPSDTAAVGQGAAQSGDQLASWMSTMMQAMSGGSNFQQQWLAQAMPMMMQMMPMMAQMMQAQRMMTANANASQSQQQAQMLQMMQQVMSAAGGQSTPAQPSPPQQPNPMPWTQPPTSRSINAAPALPSSTQQAAYFSHYQQPPPPPPSGSYGQYSRRGGEQGSMFAVRGNYSR